LQIHSLLSCSYLSQIISSYCKWLFYTLFLSIATIAKTMSPQKWLAGRQKHLGWAELV
jgi:hypothetical protein